jgi:hypothetical protein
MLLMSWFNHYHCNNCDAAWSTPENAEKCSICKSSDIHEPEYDETGVAKWRLEKYDDDRIATLRHSITEVDAEDYE